MNLFSDIPCLGSHAKEASPSMEPFWSGKKTQLRKGRGEKSEIEPLKEL